MTSEPVETVVTPEFLRGWGLPEPGDSKHSRGSVLVVGGDARSPGAAMLAGLAALRVGAGRLTLAVAASIAPHVAVAVPESGVVPLPERDGHIDGSGVADAAGDLGGADAVVIGPGLDDLDEAVALLDELPSHLDDDGVVVLDAFALGGLAQRPELRDALPSSLILTPNTTEAGFLLGGDPSAGSDDLARDSAEIARRFHAVVSLRGHITTPDGDAWRLGTGATGLGTSGSGDVLAGAIAGFCGRGVPPGRAAVWGSHVHALAGDRLSVRTGPLGYLASELLPALPAALVEIGA